MLKGSNSKIIFVLFVLTVVFICLTTVRNNKLFNNGYSEYENMTQSSVGEIATTDTSDITYTVTTDITHTVTAIPTTIITTMSKITPPIITTVIPSVTPFVTPTPLPKIVTSLLPTVASLTKTTTTNVFYIDGYPATYAMDGDAYLVGAKRNKITLINNANAKDVTWEEVYKFILNDSTDSMTYKIDSFVCADFAEMVQHNAEKIGINCGLVSIDFIQGTGHMCNAFNTIDKGIILIDCTGGSHGYIGNNLYTITIRDPTKKYYSGTGSYDTVSYVQENKILGVISISTAMNYGLQYVNYKNWLNDVGIFDKKLAEFNSKMKSRNDLVGNYNLSGGVVVGSDEDKKIDNIDLELNVIESQLDALADKIGDFWELDDRVVTKYSILW